MKKIVVSDFVSLDGVMQGPGSADEDTDGGFTQGGWVFPYWHDDIGAYVLEMAQHNDTLLVGRKTWQTHAGAFEPMPAGDPFGDMMNNFRKFVVSTTLQSADAWRDSEIISENVLEEVRSLKQGSGKNIHIDGSSVLVHALAEADLIDEYALMTFPIVLGSGKRVFPDGYHADLKLLETRTFPTGVVVLHYQVKHS